MSLLELQDFFIRIGTNVGNAKITFGPFDGSKHLTFHFGTKSKIFDIHIKDEKYNTYETLLQVEHTNLLKTWVNAKSEITNILKGLFYLRMSLVTIRKKGYIINPKISTNTSKLFKIDKKGKRLKFKKNIYTSDALSLCIRSKKICGDSELLYLFNRNNNQIGILFRILNTNNNFYFIKQKKFITALKKCFNIYGIELSKLEPEAGKQLIQLFK